MFKATIYNSGEYLLQSDFEPADFPIIKLCVLGALLTINRIIDTSPTIFEPRNKHEVSPLIVIIPEAVIKTLTGEVRKKMIRENRTEYVSDLMRSIVGDLSDCHFEGVIKKGYLTMKVAELLIEIYAKKPEPSSDGRWTDLERNSLEKVRNLIGENLKANYSIESLATEAGMNRTKLQHGFKTLYGKTIYTYAFDLRMEYGRSLLLKNKYLSLKEVADQLGYRHANHFSTAFKTKFNISPSAFKKLQ